MNTRLAGGRVLESDYLSARRVLEDCGMTVSQAIQNLMSVTARTGKVPACIAHPEGNARGANFDSLMARVEARPSVPWPRDLSDDDLLDAERMRRFG